VNRREALISLGLGSAGLLVAPGRCVAASGIASGDLEALADLFTRTPREGILPAGARAAKAGAGWRGILGGAFLAGIREVRPRHVGGKLHCVMMVESAFQMCEQLPGEEALVLALWALDDFKRSQARDESEGDWSLPPAPRVSFADEKAARAELVAAMESWDDGKADRAITGLLAFHDRESIFELLWPWAARSFGSLGHKIIFAAQVDRILGRLPWRHAEPALRSLVQGLLDKNNGRRLTSAFDRSVAIASSLPAGWREGREDPARSAGIASGILAADSAAAQRLVVDAFASGLGPATVWDGLRLAASELFGRRRKGPPDSGGALLPVHAVTETEAFGYAFQSTRSDATRRLLVLQAAGWLPDMRAALESNGAQTAGAAGLLSPRPSEGATGEAPSIDLREAMDSGDPARLRAGLGSDGARAESCRDLTRRGLARGGVEHHQHKYAAAFLAESLRVSPRWAPAILAPSAGYLPAPGAAESGIALRSRAALREAGLVP
jgi:hypothetical protein